ncbi:MAG: type I restriction endonuclease subunit R, partial [Nanoarchaeota archaeon]|nr:type I restriction endonuclease subunit R [Nanoarchaeota archaeon]
EMYKTYFQFYIEKVLNSEEEVQNALYLEDKFSKYIKNNPKRSKTLKQDINKYFHILNLIQYVIDIEEKYTNYPFLEFWNKYNSEYNALGKNDEIKDEVEIYFDDQIGIVDVPEEDSKKSRGDMTGKEKDSEYGSKKYKYDILKILEKKNKEEEVIGQSIEDFELKIDSFFNSVKESREGKILIAKINSIGTKFTEDEILADFEKVYRKFIRRHKLELGEFFISQTKDIVEYLYTDFEKQIKENLLNY